MPAGDRIARVAVRLLGTVAELRKRLGDPVEQDEVVAVIESREVADAKSEYLAARLTNELQQTLVRRVRHRSGRARSSARTTTCAHAPRAQDAQVKFDTARQKLFALGLSEEQIAALPQQPVDIARRQELRSPIAGRIAERRVDLARWSAAKARKANYSSSSICPRCGSTLRFRPPTCRHPGRAGDHHCRRHRRRARLGPTIIFVSPLLDRETRAARVVASLDNPDHAFRPGTFVTAEIPLAEEHAEVLVPKTALQTIKGERVVFVRNDEDFEARKVTVGREDDRSVEIASGLCRRARPSPSATPSPSRPSSARPKPSTSTEGRHDQSHSRLLDSRSAGWSCWSCCRVAALRRVVADAPADRRRAGHHQQPGADQHRRAGALAGRGREAGHLPDRDRAGRHSRASSTRARSRATASRR